MDKNQIYKRYAVQDNNVYDLNNVMKTLKNKLIGRESIMIMCPVCRDKASLVLVPSMTFQTRKCTRCKSECKIRVYKGFGKYKIKSSIGVEIVDGDKRTFTQDVHKQ